MRVVLRDGLIGLGVGIASGIVAGVLLAPGRRKGDGQQSTLSADLGDAVVDVAQAGVGAVQTLWRLGGGAGSGVMSDERLTLQVRDELESLGLWNSRLDVTTIDGTIYVRGREPDAQRADSIVHTIRGLGGVGEVVDEVRRE